MEKKRNNQRGFSLLQVIIAAALLAVLVVSIIRFTNILGRKVASDSGVSGIDMEKALIGGVALRIDALAKSACGGGAFNNAAGTIAAVNSFLVPGFGTVTATSSVNYAAGVDPLADAAKVRCATPVSPASAVAPGAYYFCMQLARNATAVLNRADLFNADQAFIEVRANLVDQTRVPAGDQGPYLSCTGFQASGVAGIIVYYRIYWNRAVTNDMAHFLLNGKSVFPKLP